MVPKGSIARQGLRTFFLDGSQVQARSGSMSGIVRQGLRIAATGGN